jgi:hypothetical protein
MGCNATEGRKYVNVTGSIISKFIVMCYVLYLNSQILFSVEYIFFS